ncbi:hypothetical protein APY94_06305 [Thermococcus celericrescens]|uniref:Uncharacterized protein n=1 Tax=Thermococcus celericrescens TaxID=227598 RepID=A0A100XXU5_9EURY|nr:MULTISPECIES: hypothetical protein [Thermococcaceae]KUH33345.1 hypothetical protein APY94_06305 [Thermococcus celericrescens]
MVKNSDFVILDDYANIVIEDEPANLRLILIGDGTNQYDVSVPKNMSICYLRLGRDTLDHTHKERLQFTVYTNCKEPKILIVREHNKSRKFGDKWEIWSVEEEWDFSGVPQPICSWVHKILHSLKLKLLLLIPQGNKEDALGTIKGVEKQLELLTELLDKSDIEGEYFKRKTKFILHLFPQDEFMEQASKDQ